MPNGPGRACAALSYATYAALALAAASAALLALNRLGLAFPVEGVSMLPVLHMGDLVLVAPANVSSVPLGDIVVYRSPIGIFVVHRVVEIGNGYLVVKGDNNLFPDPWKVTNSMLVGRAFLVIDYLGYLALPPYTYIIALALLSLYLLHLLCRKAKDINRV